MDMRGGVLLGEDAAKGGIQTRRPSSRPRSSSHRCSPGHAVARTAAGRLAFGALGPRLSFLRARDALIAPGSEGAAPGHWLREWRACCASQRV